MKHSLLITLLAIGCYLNIAYADSIPPIPNQPCPESELPFSMNNLTGTFDLTSNYVFRGISQTNNDPAVQGGLTYTFDSGFYLNVWGSNVNFSDAYLELDTSVGYGHKFENGIGYNLSLLRYNYPATNDLAYNEALASASYKIFQVGIAYSNQVFHTSANGTYYSAGINYDIPPEYVYNLEGLNFTGGIGRYELGARAGNSYDDFNIALSKKLNKTYTVTIAWTDTNGAFDAYPLDKYHILGTITAAF